MLVADQLVLELEFQLQQFDFVLILFNFVLQILKLPVLRIVGEHGLPHAELLVDIFHVAHSQVRKVCHLLLQQTQSRNVFLRVTSQLPHVDIVYVDVLAVDSDAASIHRHVVLAALHVGQDLVLRLLHLLFVVVPSLLQSRLLFQLFSLVLLPFEPSQLLVSNLLIDWQQLWLMATWCWRAARACEQVLKHLRHPALRVLLLFALGVAIAIRVLVHGMLAALVDLGRSRWMLSSVEGTTVSYLLAVPHFLRLVEDLLGACLEFVILVWLLDDLAGVNRFVLFASNP